MYLDNFWCDNFDAPDVDVIDFDVVDVTDFDVATAPTFFDISVHRDTPTSGSGFE